MQYLVVMHRGQKLSANMLPGVKIISLEDSGLDLMRLVVSGDGIDTEKLLKSWKQVVAMYEKLPPS